MPGGVGRRSVHGSLERSLRLCGIAAIEPPQALFPSRRRVTGRELDYAIHVGYRGLDLSAPRLEERELVPPTRLPIVEVDGGLVTLGGLDEQAVGLEAHGEATPAGAIGSFGIDGCRQFFEERRGRRIDVAVGARVGWRQAAFATEGEKRANDCRNSERRGDHDGDRRISTASTSAGLNPNGPAALLCAMLPSRSIT